LARTELHTVASFQAIQLDVQSGSARVLLPQLLTALSSAGGPLPERERELLERLSRWDFDMRTEAVEPLVFSAWVRELDRSVYADELGSEFEGLWAERIGFLSRVLADRQGQGHWCDDVSTPRRESCAERVRDALHAALLDLARRYGDDLASWSWGRAHRARARHIPFSDVPLLRDWFELTTPSAGGMNTVNVGAGRLGDDEPYESQHAAGYRAVYDLGDLGASRFLVNGGQSGHVLSPHYRDWVRPWQQGLLLPMLTQRDAIDRDALGTIRLSPSR
jgi:penicillin amidase